MTHKIQEDTKKQSEPSTDLNVSATITVTKGYKLPLAKLTLCGSINPFTDEHESKTNQIVQRAIIFVIDRSYSMHGERITMVQNALKPFIEEICDDEHTIIKLVLFNKTVEHINIPRDPVAAATTIDSHVYASGGTDFHAASQGLVQEATSILNEYPTHQLTVIMCSDGEVGKQNAERGHVHWKTFVNEQYLKIHQIVPFVETIGISTAHDADVLDGFIVDDATGNYCKCDTPQAIRDAFENAQDETMGRSATKLCIEFPLNVHNDLYGRNEENKFHLHDLIITTDEFKTDFWIGMDEYESTTTGTGGDGLYLMVNGERIEIMIDEVTGDEECQLQAIDFYNSVLKDMLHTLRNITDSEQLKLKAKEIENELSNEYIKTFDALVAEPAEKQQLQTEIKELLKVVSAEEKDAVDMEQLIKRRAQLMKRYKQMNRIWKKHRTVVTGFQHTLSCVKTLVREIILGQVRMQEIRQHILDLHFRKKHAKRMSKLVLTDEQLAKRLKLYEEIRAPKESDCADITDEIGSGCYLSTLSKRECVLDGDALWICGRVNRSGGAAVSNPELIRIEYISSDLVSDSYFRMAIEAAAGGDEADARQKNNVGFADSSRQLINARLFPIYGNLNHYEASKPFIHEVLSHTLSGRIDIRVVDYNSLSATIGYMISHNHLSSKNVKRILYEMIPSFAYFTRHTKSKPFVANQYTRETDKNEPRIKLSDKNRQRLCAYVETFKARTTAWVSKASVLMADRLMNLDIDFDAAFYLSVVVQRLRQMFSAQIPKKLEEDVRRNKVVANHRKMLQVLICGVADEKGNDCDDEKGNKYKKKLYKLFDVPSIKPIELDPDDEKVMKEWNVNDIKQSSKKMMRDILSRIDVRDLIQCHAFFNTLSAMPCDIDEATYSFDEFGSHSFAVFDSIPNDFNILCAQIGFEHNWNVLRAMCCVSIICHSNRLWQDNLKWFGDDTAKQLFRNPQSVLSHIYKHFVIRNIRHDFDVSQENKRIDELIAMHSDPVLPDDVDEFGHLPNLRCGWKKCGKEFDNRDKLLDHVRRCIPHPFVHCFHIHCRQVLENDPDLSLNAFMDKTLALFAEDKRKLIKERELACYYQQFKSMFKKGIKWSRPQPDIVSTKNMYYFDQLVCVRKD